MNSSLCSGCPLEGRPCVTPNRAGEQKGGLYILGGFPDARSATERGKGSVPFMGQRSNLIRSIMNKLYMRLPAGDKPTCYYGYACCCNPSYNRETKRYDISADIISRCANYARDFIDLQQPDVILAMGVDAYRALNIKGVVSAKRGTLEPFTDKNGRTVPVVCTYDLSTIVKNHGLVNVFVSDCQKALDVYYGTRNHTEPTVHCPVTVPEILAKLKNLEEGINRSQQEAVPVAFDTETTSLLPHVKEDRIIVMSFSWAKNKGLAFPFDHRKAPFSFDERKAIQEAAERILNHPKVKLLMANGSFDMRYLWGRGIKCPPQYWDVILAEHTLDEAKQGEYSLKDITRDRLPGYANYEEELKKIREVAWKDKDAEVRKLEEEAKEKTRQNLLEWWVGLDTATRIELLAKWAAAKYITVKDTAFLAEVKRVKRKGELVIPKKYLDSLSRMAKRLPDTEIPQEIVVEPDIPDELKFKSYEDIDLDTILRYAAMDVITTRMIYDIQLEEMRKSDIQDQLNRRKYGKEMSMLRPVGEAYMNITMPLSEQLARMQLHGIRMDRDRIREYQGILERKTEEVLDRMRTEIGVSFNPNSSADLVKILYEDLKLPILNYTDSGAPAVDKESLNNLADAHPDLNFLNDLLLYRRLSKTSGTYLKNWLDKSAYDGRLHTDFLQTGTATYRLSSSNPR